MIGYCATASKRIEIAPIRQMNSAIDPGEDRPVDEEAGHRSVSSARRCVARRRPIRIQPRHPHRSTRSTLTLSPGSNFWKPSTTTRSPGFRPSLTSHCSSCTAPVRTGCAATRSSSLTTNTSLPPPASRWIACCGTAIASPSMPCSISTRTYMPGSNSRFGLANSPRSVTWPVKASTLASENSSLPGTG